MHHLLRQFQWHQLQTHLEPRWLQMLRLLRQFQWHQYRWLLVRLWLRMLLTLQLHHQRPLLQFLKLPEPRLLRLVQLSRMPLGYRLNLQIHEVPSSPLGLCFQNHSIQQDLLLQSDQLIQSNQHRLEPPTIPNCLLPQLAMPLYLRWQAPSDKRIPHKQQHFAGYKLFRSSTYLAKVTLQFQSHLLDRLYP